MLNNNNIQSTPSSLLLYPILLSIGSSTDNFTVGASLGLSSKRLYFHVNFIISIANAIGAFVSCAGGYLLETFLFHGMAMAPILASFAFLYLAWEEYQSSIPSNTLVYKKKDKDANVLSLAIPMTLNNLAGGMVAGTAGVQPLMSGLMAFIASFVMMLLGYYLGRWMGNAIGQRIDTTFISCGIYVILALLSFMEY